MTIQQTSVIKSIMFLPRQFKCSLRRLNLSVHDYKCQPNKSYCCPRYFRLRLVPAGRPTAGRELILKFAAIALPNADHFLRSQ